MKINPPMNSNSIQANADALPFANLAKHSCSTQQNEKGDAAQGLRSFFDRSTPKTGHLPVIAALITTLSLLPVAGAEPNPASNLPLRPSDHRVHSAAVTEHGAIGDAKTLNTRTIQAAIDAVAASGGGFVHFPPGNYLCGAVSLKSRVTLSLEAGAILLGSTNEADYKSVAKSALITGDDLDDVAIIGRGTIDGQGAAFPRQGFRPMNIQIANSRNVLIEGIKLRNAASWVQKYARCEDLVIRGIQVESLSNANNDGLDIDSCRNVRVTDSRIWSGDDAFVFKSTYDRPCENVVIANCIASSHCNAFKLGTESYGGFKNISIANCVVIPMGVEMKWHGSTEGNCGICLTSVDGGTIENVAISNISIRGTLSPVFIRLGNKGRTFRPENTKQEIGHIRKVSINNVTAVSAGRAGCEITGLPEHMIEDVSLNNIHITYQGGGRGPNWGMNKMPVKENPEAYPDILWTHAWVPSYGLFTRHVRGLTLNNFTVKTETKDPRSAMIFQDIEELRLDGVSAQAAPGSDATFWFDRVRGALVRGCVAMPNTSVFARLDGACADFAFLANDLRKAAKPFEFVGGAAAGMVQESGNLQSGTPSLRQPKNQSLDSP